MDRRGHEDAAAVHKDLAEMLAVRHERQRDYAFQVWTNLLMAKPANEAVQIDNSCDTVDCQ
eukprot:4455935-Pyramimonas_sp.AAC.1